jgi:hypothetical protein
MFSGHISLICGVAPNQIWVIFPTVISLCASHSHVIASTCFNVNPQPISPAVSGSQIAIVHILSRVIPGALIAFSPISIYIASLNIVEAYVSF